VDKVGALARAATLAAFGACSLLLASAGDTSAAAGRVTLTVTPRDTLLDQPVSISVTGLRPRSTVTLTATTRSANQTHKSWRSTATFRADASGRVVVARSRSLGGTYRGRDGMGLFWSMRWRSCDDCTMIPASVSTVRLVASSGGRTLATGSFTQRAQAPGVTVRNTTLAGEGFVGRFYSPRDGAARPAPAVLRLGGSGGGLQWEVEASLLASHGYPTLALAYFGVPGLPGELKNIPLEYFESALRWLGQQPGVDPSKLIVQGGSRGAECALLLGTVYPELVHGVVSYVGSSLVWGTQYTVSGPHDPPEASWTLAGKPVPFATGSGVDPEAVIPVEKIAGPIFLVGAVLDDVWPSANFANEIVARLRQHQRTDYASLVYYNAGHAVGAAVPNVAVGAWGGGTLAGDAQARADSWPKLLAFLERLRGQT
jgi:dienelactone hydrolase